MMLESAELPSQGLKGNLFINNNNYLLYARHWAGCSMSIISNCHNNPTCGYFISNNYQKERIQEFLNCSPTHTQNHTPQQARLYTSYGSISKFQIRILVFIPLSRSNAFSFSCIHSYSLSLPLPPPPFSPLTKKRITGGVCVILI